MSANLWKAENVISAEALEDGIYACSGMRGVRTNVTLDRLAANQTFHCGFSVNPGKDDKLSMALCYRDAAGSVNYAFTTEASAPAGKWTRVSNDVVVPSGMTVYQMVIYNNGNASGASGWKVMNPTLSLGSPVCLASSSHTPYATQGHLQAVYATQAQLARYIPISGGTLTGPLEGTLTGNASTASRLSTARTIALSGAVTGSAKFDGSGDVSISTTANESYISSPISGLYNMAVDADGNLWVYHSDSDKAPNFEYDSATGDLYYVTEA